MRRLLISILLATIGFVQPVSAYPSFKSWIEDVKKEARRKGISVQTVAQLDFVKRNEKIVVLSNKQPEYIRPPWEYIERMLTETRIRRGKKLLQQNKYLFQRLEKHFGVSRYILTAIWGMETNFGSYQGELGVLQSLATLSYEQSRRQKFWRQQLFAALEIIDSGDISAKNMKGSWAGAMGQTQFIPTTYLAHAIDFTGDGKRDIWGSSEDALGSTANYLKVSGWNSKLQWGYEVTLPKRFDYTQADLSIKKSMKAWYKTGVRSIRNKIPNTKDKASIFMPAGHMGPVFLVTENFRSILRYNTANIYALTAGLLSEQLQGELGINTPWPVKQRPLQPKELVELQKKLLAYGYNIGKADGILGTVTRRAIKKFQNKNGLTPDGHPTAQLLFLFKD